MNAARPDQSRRWHGARIGNESVDYRTRAVVAGARGKDAAKLRNALTHPKQTMRHRFIDSPGIDADAIVDHAQAYAFVLATQDHAHALGLRVLGDIVQRFLSNTIQRD